MRLSAFIVNAFAEDLACGNPAGVVFSEEALPDRTMRDLAADLGKSETAFLTPRGRDYGIRWFSPLKEMPLCGHATLGAARVIFGRERDRTGIEFSHAGGAISARGAGDGFIGLTSPLDGYERIEPDPEWLGLLGLDRAEDCVRGLSTGKVILAARADFDLADLRPDFRRMRARRGPWESGVAVTKPSAAFDFETRYFNPWAGVDEDPVTGSVHTVLAGYWRDRLGRSFLTGYQASRRPGTIRMGIDGDRVELAGKARVVFEGTVTV